MIKQVAVEKTAASNYGVLAQLGEHLPYKQRVTGSSPVGPIDLSEYGGIAQLARAHGSYPWCRWFKSSFRYEERGLNFRSLLFFAPRVLDKKNKGERKMLMSIACILLLGMMMGWLCKKVHLPGLLGMLVTGIVLGPYALNLIDASILNISSELRKIALIIILARAGLSLNLEDLKKVGRPAILMCFVPACFEVLGMILLAPRLLGVSILDAAIMGTVVGAVSPAVIVPKMLKLMEENYGTGKGCLERQRRCRRKMRHRKSRQQRFCILQVMRQDTLQVPLLQVMVDLLHTKIKRNKEPLGSQSAPERFLSVS